MSNESVVSSQAALDWLALLDAGHYAESWQASGEIFRLVMSSDEWAEKVGVVRARVGVVTGRKAIRSSQLQSLDGLPDGQYTVHEFETSFADGGNLGERVTTVFSDAGNAMVVGYYII